MKVLCAVLTACLLACLFSPPAVQAGGELGLAPYDAGGKLLAKKHFKTARKYFQKALDQQDARGHYGLGLLLEATGKEEDAAGEYRRFVEVGPQGPERSDAAWRLAAIEERRKAGLEERKKAGSRERRKAGSQERRKAEAARPLDLLERGKSLLKSGKYREAEEALLQAAAKEPSNPEVHFSLGDVYLALEAFDKAKAEYEKATRHF